MTGSPDAAVRPAAARLAAAGFGVLAPLPAAAWDALVPPAWHSAELLPAARSAWIVGAGGRSLFAAFEAAPEAAAGGPDPLDRYTERVVSAVARGLGGRAVFAWQRRGGAFADFVALGRAAGLGAPSRLGLLLHPVYGPWWSLRAVVLAPVPPGERSAVGDFDPCRGCAAPCAVACPGAAVAPGGFDVARCGATRRVEPGCRLRCAARRACVVGPEHGYTDAAEAHHMAASAPP